MPQRHLAHMIRDSVSAHGARAAMSYRDNRLWKNISYEEMGARIDGLAKALIDEGIAAGDTVGIFSQNRPEWALADFAVLSAGAISVPIYATSTAKQAAYMVNDAEIKLIFTGDSAQYKKVKASLGSTPSLRRIVVFDRKVHIEGSESLYYDDFIMKGTVPRDGRGTCRAAGTGVPRRHCHDNLHLGHHGGSEGGDAHPR